MYVSAHSSYDHMSSLISHLFISFITFIVSYFPENHVMLCLCTGININLIHFFFVCMDECVCVFVSVFCFE